VAEGEPAIAGGFTGGFEAGGGEGFGIEMSDGRLGLTVEPLGDQPGEEPGLAHAGGSVDEKWGYALALTASE
jgi:hypothetical protein